MIFILQIKNLYKNLKMIPIRSLTILLIATIAMANSLNLKALQLKNSKHAKMSKRELADSNLERLQLEAPANLKSNVAKEEANVKLEQGDALKATNQDTKSTKLEADIKFLKSSCSLDICTQPSPVVFPECVGCPTFK